jgi:hypothetical protein
MIPGSPISYLWTKQSDGFHTALQPITTQYGNGYTSSTADYLKANPVDVLVLQIFPDNGDSYIDRWAQPHLNDGTITGMLGFAGAAYQGNPNCQVYLYASHTMDNGKTDNSMADNIIGYKALMDTLTKAYPGKKHPWIIPAPLGFNAMKDEGFGDLWSADGHANGNGRYFLGVLFYSIIYRRDCAGATHTPTALSAAALPTVSASFAAKAQSVAWQIARTSQYSGVTGTAAAPRPAVTLTTARRTSQSSAATWALQGRALCSAPSSAVAQGLYVSNGRSVALRPLAR